MIKLKKGDTVQVNAGKDKGKKGKVIQVFPQERRVVVEGINKLKKHLRPKGKGEKGQTIELSAPLDISNLSLVCSKCNKLTRVAFTMIDKKKVRICAKCHEVIS